MLRSIQRTQLVRSIKASSLFRMLYGTIITYPTPTNLTYVWNFGIFALAALIIQILTGIILVMHYTPHLDLAFVSIEHIMRDVNMGWLLRYIHANGASIFFIVVYAHIFRGLFYGSYLNSREFLWCSGVIILLFMIITAFLGYILPWGQMSLWGATVITNLASTIPMVGENIVVWLWGGFSVANPTLTKFFSLHYLFPFLILALVGLHLLLLHASGSSNPLGVAFRPDGIPMAPYYLIKDFFSIFIFFAGFGLLIFFTPNELGHPDNYIPANLWVTPAHIVPEWYFLPFYAILRSIPDKLLGVLALLASILILFFLPFLHKSNLRSSMFKPVFKTIVFIFFGLCFNLCYIGSKPITEPFLTIGQISTVLYFSFFIIIIIADRCDHYIFRNIVLK